MRFKKFDNGNRVILCNNCYRIVMRWSEITALDWEDTSPVYCIQCKALNATYAYFEELGTITAIKGL